MTGLLELERLLVLSRIHKLALESATVGQLTPNWKVATSELIA